MAGAVVLGGDEKELGRGKLVCVTGGAGYVASWLIMRLLQRGYSVRATIRSGQQFHEETKHIESLEGAKERLEIVDADLSKPGSYDAAVDGCIGVFHVAHPTNFNEPDPEASRQKQVIKPAVEGAVSILEGCLKSKTVRRVVFTSSASAVVFSGRPDLQVMDESVWSDVDYCRKLDVPGASYFISKTLAEKAALDFSEAHPPLEVVTLLPSSVLGPFLTPNFPPSFLTTMALVLGDVEHCKLLKQMQYVHIDDLASAYIFLFECPEAKGRYICSSHDATIHQLAALLSTKFPRFSPNALIQQFIQGLEEEKPVHLSSQKLLSLGFKFKYGLEEMYEGAIKCCQSKGFLKTDEEMVTSLRRT
ncbi:Dihydroflavonol-4-reductase [Nymphaea thermarum]|nr:Dihydroflavonol-4-reductase [Nymphaea thermarum]